VPAGDAQSDENGSKPALPPNPFSGAAEEPARRSWRLRAKSLSPRPTHKEPETLPTQRAPPPAKPTDHVMLTVEEEKQRVFEVEQEVPGMGLPSTNNILAPAVMENEKLSAALAKSREDAEAAQRALEERAAERDEAQAKVEEHAGAIAAWQQAYEALSKQSAAAEQALSDAESEKATASAALSETAEAARSQVASLSEALARAEARNAESEKTIAAYEAESKASADSALDAAWRLEQAKREHQDAAAQEIAAAAERYEADLEALRAQLDEAKNANAKEDAFAVEQAAQLQERQRELTEALDSERARSLSLEAALEDARASSSTANATAQASEAKTRELEAALAEASAPQRLQAEAELQMQIADLQAAVAVAEASAAQSQADLEATRAEVASLAEEKSALADEAAALRERAATAASAGPTTAEKTEELEAEVSELRRADEAQRATIARLEQEVATHQATAEKLQGDLQSTVAQYETLETQAAERERVRAELEAAIAELSAGAARAEAAREEAARELADTQRAVASKEQALAVASADDRRHIEQDLASLQARLEEANDGYDRAGHDLAHAKAKLEEGQTHLRAREREWDAAAAAVLVSLQRSADAARKNLFWFQSDTTTAILHDVSQRILTVQSSTASSSSEPATPKVRSFFCFRSCHFRRTYCRRARRLHATTSSSTSPTRTPCAARTAATTNETTKKLPAASSCNSPGGRPACLSCVAAPPTSSRAGHPRAWSFTWSPTEYHTSCLLVL